MNFIRILEEWYKFNKRQLPWRETSDPYKIWISEIIFQQTRINQGYNYYLKFINKFPNIEVLAKAEEDEVLAAWQGLGYYSRAHNLYFTAKHVFFELKGVFPNTYSEILKLKGIGKYTAAAIASIAFAEKVPAIDGNAFRVYSRLFDSERDIRKTTTFTYFFDLIKLMIPENSGDFNQAIMDLGAMICLPKNPKCLDCPINKECVAYKKDKQNELPIKTNITKIKEEEIHYAFISYSNKFLVVKRDNHSIWKGLYEFLKFKDEFRELEINHNYNITHKLSHKLLFITISEIIVEETIFYKIADQNRAVILNKKGVNRYAFPKPLENFLLYINF